MDSYVNTNLRCLIEEHNIDTICEEATGVLPKSCVELLADELNLRWKNVDATQEERKLIPDRGDGDQVQDLEMHTQREFIWVVRISEAVTESGLLICGLCHVFTIAEKLRELFECKVLTYDPRRIYNWDDRQRPRVSPRPKVPQ
jgi:hypothetical protein